jgi:hypothetical protein
MLEIDLASSHSYEVEELPELPGSGGFDVPVFYFPQPKNRPEHNGLWLKVAPAIGKSWIGVFAFFFDPRHSFSRVVSTLDPDCVCVISGSAGYIVKVVESVRRSLLFRHPLCNRTTDQLSDRRTRLFADLFQGFPLRFIEVNDSSSLRHFSKLP